MSHETFEEFKKANPHLNKLWPYLNLLNKESDRGKVLISTGFLEEQLKIVLLAFMLDTSQAKEMVEGGNAPFGTFSARITACYVLGLITENEHHDLNLVRRIRNDFAHDIHTSFDTQSIVDRCDALKMRAPNFVYENNPHPDWPLDAASHFLTAAIALIMHLINRPHYVSNKRCSAEEWPY